MTAVQEYEQKRAVLIKADRALRIDYISSPPTESLEDHADKLIRQIRAEEAVATWGVEHEGIPHPYPGMEFLLGKDIIAETRLFKILKNMPKGALLHVHLELTVDAHSLLRLALPHRSIHIRSPEVITSVNLSSVVPEIKPLDPDFKAEVFSLTDPTYIPASWAPLHCARELFNKDLGGSRGFDKWVTNHMVINASTAYVTHNNNKRVWYTVDFALLDDERNSHRVDQIWNKFRSSAHLYMSLVCYTPIWEQYIRLFLEDTIADGVMYVEARVNFSLKYMIGPDGKENVPHIEWLRAFKRVVDRFKQEKEDFVDAKIIYTVIRDCDTEGLRAHLQDCLAMTKAFPGMIVGFDLVGEENSLRPLREYIEPLLQFKEHQKQEGTSIPYIFHAGETCGDGTLADENLYDAILLGTKRIGHGFSLVKHPKLMQICREQKIALEVCSISNDILRLTGSMPMHPLPILLNNGVPVVLGSDDPALFQNKGLTYDFFQVLVASEVSGLLTLGHLARDSIAHSMLADAEKACLMQKWEERWTSFLRELVALYGPVCHLLGP